ncbi:hypothetical protein [Arthrobacter sp. STN4]|uniref:hypothetical protein n=1 Tax=Arthrobacter sp. STN4 TaxID=2923276 RepID=UPI00211A69B7|nr:hypothetical protein [Arthrobacter sp. STN4]MCQ9164016.1 hypothetical protein [Arthrobacter sp. STN4]
MFTEFLVSAGARFGEAVAVTVADLNLSSRPGPVRITKAWKHVDRNRYFVSATKTRTGKRTVFLPGHPVMALVPVMAGRQGRALLFTDVDGDRITRVELWRQRWLPAITAAREAGLGTAPRSII